MEPQLSEQQYPIFIKTLTGRVIELCVSPNDLVRTLKLKVSDKTGISPNAQRYVYQAKQLDDNVTMLAAGIRKESIVNLIVRQDLESAPAHAVASASSASTSRRRGGKKAGGASSEAKNEDRSESMWDDEDDTKEEETSAAAASTQSHKSFGRRRGPPPPRQPQAWEVQPLGGFDDLRAALHAGIAFICKMLSWPFRVVIQVLDPPITFIFGFFERYIWSYVLYYGFVYLLGPAQLFILRDLPDFFEGNIRGRLVVLNRAIDAYVAAPFDQLVYLIGSVVLAPFSELLAIPWEHVLAPVLWFVCYSARATFKYALHPLGRRLWLIGQHIATLARETIRFVHRVLWHMPRTIHRFFLRPLNHYLLAPFYTNILVPMLRGVFISLPQALDNAITLVAQTTFRYAIRPMWHHIVHPVLRFGFVSTPRVIARAGAWLARSSYTYALAPLWRSVCYPLLRFCFVSVPRGIANYIVVPCWTHICSPLLRFTFLSVPRTTYNHLLTPLGHALRATGNAVHAYVLRPVLQRFVWGTLMRPLLQLSHSYLFSPFATHILQPIARSSMRLLRFLFSPIVRSFVSLLLPRGVWLHGYAVDVRPARFLHPNIMIMQDNAEYGIHIRNNTRSYTDCTIAIDGVDMGRFRLVPNSRYVISRPAESDARFCFQANAAVRANAQQLGNNNNAVHFGSEVRVSFFQEVRGGRQQHASGSAAAPEPHDSRSTESITKMKDHSITGGTKGNGNNDRVNDAIASEEFVSGGTVLRGRSDQQVFSNHHRLRTRDVPDVVIVVRLVGEAPRVQN